MSTYAEERHAAIRARNMQSKRRAAEMERFVAKFLGGNRIPMSGAGTMKGDCDVVTDKIGKVFIECKYSAQIDAKRGPMVRITYQWLDKMHKDALTMHAKFAALIFRYHDQRLSSYVIISTDVLEKYWDIGCIVGAAVIDTNERSGHTMFKKHLEQAMVAHERKEPFVVLKCNRGLYAITTIAKFKEIIHGTNCI